MKEAIITLLTCCFAQFGFSQPPQTTKLNNYVDTLELHNKFMGVICVNRADQNIYTKSAGFSDIENRTPSSQSTKYRIGSISKSFTAVMTFQAIEQGKITLSTTLDNYFPNIKNANTTTIDLLLGHRSGIHNFTDSNYPSWATKNVSRSELLKIIEQGGSDFAPATKAQYSNSNYVLLSYILEDVYHKPFSEILQTYIIKPLKLANTSFGGLACKSYTYDKKWNIAAETDPSIPMGAGGIVSTASDLNSFFSALFSEKLISQNSLEQMKTMTDGFGRGLFQMPFGSKIGYGHGGVIDGFNAISIYFPEDKIAYSLTSNGEEYITNNISIAVLSAIYNIPFEIPNFTVIHYTSANLDKYLGVYSSEQLPIKITITKVDSSLIAQGTGQSPFKLEASTDNHSFRFDKGGIVILFDPTHGTMLLKQGGVSFLMKKED
ncbi:MAG: serine hydrolase domain-containing protein [Mucinivorans sp.]